MLKKRLFYRTERGMSKGEEYRSTFFYFGTLTENVLTSFIHLYFYIYIYGIDVWFVLLVLEESECGCINGNTD